MAEVQICHVLMDDLRVKSSLQILRVWIVRPEPLYCLHVILMGRLLAGVFRGVRWAEAVSMWSQNRAVAEAQGFGECKELAQGSAAHQYACRG